MPPERKSKVRTAPGATCSVVNCENIGVRSISIKRLRAALKDLKLRVETKRVHICKEHYKQFKRSTRRERTMERLAWSKGIS
jgi:hypothetical protein